MDKLKPGEIAMSDRLEPAVLEQLRLQGYVRGTTHPRWDDETGRYVHVWRKLPPTDFEGARVDALKEAQAEGFCVGPAPRQLSEGESAALRRGIEQAKARQFVVGPDVNDRGYCSELGGPRAARFDSGKPSVSEVPPELVLGAAEVFAFGREKYARWNWMKGFPYLQPYESAMRHLLSWRAGEDLDDGPGGSGLHHLKHVACNVAMLLYFIKNHPELDDRPVVAGLEKFRGP